MNVNVKLESNIATLVFITYRRFALIIGLFMFGVLFMTLEINRSSKVNK